MKDQNKRVTVYLTPSYHRALRVKAAETDYSVSDLINEAVKRSLAEDAADLEAFDKRKAEPLISLESVLKDLKKDGKI